MKIFALESPRRLAGPWLIAATAAVFLHGGAVALGAFGLADADEDNELGANATEVALEFEAPHREPSFLPPGPEADSSTAAAAALAQEKKIEESDLPEVKAQETEEAEQQAAPARNKPTEDKPKVTQNATAASEAAQASEASAAPSSLAARESTQARAPAPGLGEQARLARMTWQKKLVAHLDRAKRYPAEGGGRSATIVVRFRIDRMGHLLKAEAAPGERDVIFETAAIAMMKRADPTPPPPPEIADNELTFDLPVNFRSKTKM